MPPYCYHAPLVIRCQLYPSRKKWNPTKRTVLTCLMREIKMHEFSQKDADGVLRDKHVLRTIANLREAIRLIK